MNHYYYYYTRGTKARFVLILTKNLFFLQSNCNVVYTPKMRSLMFVVKLGLIYHKA
jgi:hypothetical protein